MTTGLDLSHVRPGFSDPVLDSQSTFRKVLDAMSRPGVAVSLDVAAAPTGLNGASAALALTLMDFDTPIYLSESLQSDAVTSWLRFHCSAPLTEAPREAAFAILAESDAWPMLDQFNPGDAKYPDLSTTLILQVEALTGGPEIGLTGPGIQDEAIVSPRGLPEDFWDVRAKNVAAFQLGVDCFITSGHGLFGLPRTTRHKFK